MTRIDRRALFATGSAAALLAAVGVSAAARPARGGHLRAALSGGDRGAGWLDRPGGLFHQAARHTLFETLTEVAPDGTLQPGLATAWRPDAGGRVWEFELREDVAFHDGSPLTVGDAVASLSAQGFAAESRRTGLRVTLPRPDPAFPFRAARGGHAIFRAAELTDGRIANGTGLYRMRRFEQGRHLLAERVERHRKDGLAGWADTVELVAVSDERVRAEAVRDAIVNVVDLRRPYDLDGRSDLRVVRAGDEVVAALGQGVQTAPRTGPAPLDDMRFAERWWLSRQ
jgi:peptide/nickel transport system substrate-binding protein